jgi:hypothetical protein
VVKRQPIVAGTAERAPSQSRGRVAGLPQQAGPVAEPGLAPPHLAEASARADAASLGLPALAELIARTEYGVAVMDAERRYVYANPAPVTCWASHLNSCEVRTSSSPSKDESTPPCRPVCRGR